MDDVQLTPAELDEARAKMARLDDRHQRATYALGSTRAALTHVLNGTPHAETSARAALALAAVVDDIPDRRTVLAAKLARAEFYAGRRAGFWAPLAERYRGELAALDAEPAGTAAQS